MVARAARASWVNEQDTQGGELNKKTTIPLTIKAFTSASFHFNRLKRLEVSQQWLTKSGINNKNISLVCVSKALKSSANLHARRTVIGLQINPHRCGRCRFLILKVRLGLVRILK